MEEQYLKGGTAEGENVAVRVEDFVAFVRESEAHVR